MWLQIVEDLKTVKLDVETQQNFFKEAVTQMQSRHEDALRQLEENYQNSTKVSKICTHPLIWDKTGEYKLKSIFVRKEMNFENSFRQEIN